MSKFAIAGVLSVIAAGLVFGYQAISSVMGPKATYKTILLMDVLDKQIVSWVDGISSEAIFKIADYIITSPLYLIFIVVGVILLIISSFRWH
jgi:hypothetical protein